MSMDSIATAIHDTTLSSFIRGDLPGTEWVFPIIETFHVLCLTVVFGSIAMIDLRLIGFVTRDVPFRKLYRELAPLTWTAFVGAVVFGTILATGKIEDYLHSSWFIAKFILMAAAGINMLVFHFGAYQQVANWDTTVPTSSGARLAGTLSLLFWIGIVVCGRWVGFVT